LLADEGVIAGAEEEDGEDAVGVEGVGDLVEDDEGVDAGEEEEGVDALGAEGDDGVVALGVEGDDGVVALGAEVVDTVGLAVDEGVAVVGAPVTGFTEGARVRTVLGDTSVKVTFLTTLWPLSLMKRLPDESRAMPSG
jgi:hypothetical protein